VCVWGNTEGGEKGGEEIVIEPHLNKMPLTGGVQGFVVVETKWYEPDCMSNTARLVAASYLRKVMPGDPVAAPSVMISAFLPSRTGDAASNDGMKTVATVLAGMVKSYSNLPSPRHLQSLSILPEGES